ncbi:FkbM family methyltransferase [Methylobacterium sp. JK268]
MAMRALKNAIPPSVRPLVRSLRRRYDPIWNLNHRANQRKFNHLQVQHLRAMLRQRAVDLVIDVGANEGQFGRFLRREVGYTGRILSFEPVSATFARLAETAAGDPNWQVVNAAAGSSPGTLTINIMRESVFNSFRRPDDANVFSDLNQVVGQEEVAVHRLDAYLPENGIAARSIFLKADTQGFDLEVIRGAAGAIGTVQAVQTELSFIGLYEGMAPYHDVLDELGRMGFAVSTMVPVTLVHLQAIEFDCLLVRRVPGDTEACRTYEQFIDEAIHA